MEWASITEHMGSVPSLVLFKNTLKFVVMEQCKCFNSWLGFVLFLDF